MVVSDFKNVCKEFYINKTNKRINQFLKDNNINDKEQILNGVKVPNINYLIDKLDVNSLCDGVPVVYHGDCVLENIILNNDGYFTLIDWRQDFGGVLNYGDIYYDLAKLNHNLTFDHDILHKSLFTVSIHHDGSVVADVLRSEKAFSAKNIRKLCKIKWLGLNKVKIITALVWFKYVPTALKRHI
jgi:thiamine kinase-like enzyme